MKERYWVKWVDSEKWTQVSANGYADTVWVLGVMPTNTEQTYPFIDFKHKNFEGMVEIIEEKPPVSKNSRILSLAP